jgi:hypothetical protein
MQAECLQRSIALPFKMDIYADGNLVQKVTITEHSLDPAAGPALFEGSP